MLSELSFVELIFQNLTIFLLMEVRLYLNEPRHGLEVLWQSSGFIHATNPAPNRASPSAPPRHRSSSLRNLILPDSSICPNLYRPIPATTLRHKSPRSMYVCAGRSIKGCCRRCVIIIRAGGMLTHHPPQAAK